MKRGAISQRGDLPHRTPHFTQHTVSSRQKERVGVVDNSIANDLATFGDLVIGPKQPARAQSVPRNQDRPALHIDSFALPQERPKAAKPAVEEDPRPRLKPSANWRLRQSPNFEKIGDRNHEQRVRSEQARLASQRL